MERRQFTREFKLEAVRLIKERGVSYAQASADLDVHPTQLQSAVAVSKKVFSCSWMTCKLHRR
jgi:transposase-like protein